MSFLMDVFVSTGSIIITLVISQFLRELVRDKLPKERLGRLLLLEFIGSFEMVSVAYECSVVLGVGGVSLYALFILLVWYWRTQNWIDVSASPCTFIEDWVTRRIQFTSLCIVVLAQLAGGFMSYSYFTTLYWRIGLADTHTHRLHEGFQEECTSSIVAHPSTATIAEALGVFVYIILSKLIGRVKYLEGLAGLLNAFIGTTLVILAFDISGGYYNPVLASAMQYGCSGSTIFEHLQVYWIGGTLGTLAAYGFDLLLIQGFEKARVSTPRTPGPKQRKKAQ